VIHHHHRVDEGDDDVDECDVYDGDLVPSTVDAVDAVRERRTGATRGGGTV
jgi:hypothetical protein|tara:strand:+ start:303 stop:455 length:153 start_codon:yes stop_codon:yes gene_type:complete